MMPLTLALSHGGEREIICFHLFMKVKQNKYTPSPLGERVGVRGENCSHDSHWPSIAKSHPAT
jgi:hypothetical protein